MKNEAEVSAELIMQGYATLYVMSLLCLEIFMSVFKSIEMSESSKKRTLDAFFKPPTKKPKVLEAEDGCEDAKATSEPVSLSVTMLQYLIHAGLFFTPLNISLSDTIFSRLDYKELKLFPILNWQKYQRPGPFGFAVL
jgi:hypothetical protein